jgi:hypothetical protein
MCLLSVVSIKSTVDAKTVRKEAWISAVADAMNIFFDCKAYSTAFNRACPPKIEWSFYGMLIF